jgi:class 3 adenylate cyclase
VNGEEAPVLPVRPASDADRQLAVAALREGAGRGAIDLTELEDRLSLVLKARTVTELTELTWDLRPASVASELPRPRRFWQRVGFRYDAAGYVLTNGFLVGTWAVTGHGFFWPYFPITGWGILLGIHGVVAASLPHRHPRELPAAPVVPALRQRALDPAIGVGSVRYVAVMFADMANSTGLNEAMGDEAWSRLRARHFQEFRDCVETHDGAEVSSHGDGMFARFDLPVQAVACAVEMQRRIDEHQTASGFAPSVRIGIHAGEVLEKESDLIGNVVNLASRVTAAAEPGEILVTEPVADKLGSRFEVDDRGLKTLKGVSRPRHLLAVRW